MNYDDLQILTLGRSLPLSATNENGEDVIIEQGKNTCGHFFRTTTIQKNDWCRINTYYDDGTITETFEK